MLGDISDRDKHHRMREGMKKDLKKAMLVFPGVSYDQFAPTAARIDPPLMKTRKERQAKDGKKTSTSDSTFSVVGKGKGSKPQQSSGAQYCPTSGSKCSVFAFKELKPEVSRQEVDRLSLKEVGHFRRDCPKLQQSASNTISFMAPLDLGDCYDQIPFPTINKVRQGYAVKDTRSYRDAALGKPKLEAPAWSVDKEKIATQAEDQDSSHSSTLPRLEESFITRIRINNVEARCLIDIGASGDFISSHFTFLNRLKHHKLNAAIPIQQAVRGSKRKCIAIATATIQFGDWKKRTSLYVIHLANYDAIICLPTLMDAGARFDLASNALHLQGYDVSLPLERFQPTSRAQRRPPTSRASGATPSVSESKLSAASATIPPRLSTILHQSRPLHQLSRCIWMSINMVWQITIGILSTNTIRMSSLINYLHSHLRSAPSIIASPSRLTNLGWPLCTGSRSTTKGPSKRTSN
jgi:hypothetical protein